MYRKYAAEVLVKSFFLTPLLGKSEPDLSLCAVCKSFLMNFSPTLIKNEYFQGFFF